MADSFFGFDTSLSNVNERDDGGGREASEDEYDALNDETFGGSGEDGDWEQQHEELSMLQERDKNHSDLEAYLSHLMLEEYEDFSPEAESPMHKRQHQQNVSAKSAPMPIPSTSQHSNHHPPIQPPLPPQIPPPMQAPTSLQALTSIAAAPPSTSWMKNALSVEELERNIMRQQQQNSQPQQQKSSNQQQHQQPYPAMNQQHMQQQQQQQPMNQINIHQQQMNQQQQMSQQLNTMLMPPQLQQQQQHLQHQKQMQQQPQPQMQQQQPNMPPQMQQHPGMQMMLPFFQPRFPNNMVPPGPPPSLMGPRPQFMTGPPPPIHPFGNLTPNIPLNKMPMGILQRAPNTVTNLQTLEKQQQMSNMNHPPPPHMQMNNMQQPMTQQLFNNPPPGTNIQQPMPNIQQHMNNQQQQNNLINQQNQPLASLIQSINNANQGNVNQQNKVNQQIVNGTQVNHQPQMNMLNQQQPLQPNSVMNQKNTHNNRMNQQQQQVPFKQQPIDIQQQQQLNNSQQQKKYETRVFSQKEVMQLIQETHPLLQKNNMLKPMYRRKLEDGIGNNMNQQLNTQRNDVDQYSGLMTQRQKQWLLNIQLMQLNTGTPYIDDYYYTVFLDRQAKKEKQELKEAHKANQQNHPFSQHNLTNNRFGNNSNNTEGGRERRNSSRSVSDNNTNKDGPKTYVPTQFENSLGKLQCGSVTAPRKIIDMEVVASESGASETNGSTPNATTSSRGSRQALLTIESLYRILLRVEDLSEPMAIATALVLKEREEKQKALLLEQQQNALDDDEPSSPPVNDSANHFLRGIESVVKQQQNSKDGTGTSSASTSLSISAPNLLDENKTDLLGKLMAALLYEERLNHILLFRKGKTLVVRILNQATPIEWWRAPLGRLWPRLLRCLPSCCRRDAHCLSPITTHFRNYLNGTEGWAPVSDLCQVLTEGAQQGLTFSVNIRASTPALQHRGLMSYMLSTQLGLSLLVILFERAAMLNRPVPAAWTALVRAAAKQALQAPTATAVTSRPTVPLPRNILATHASSTNLSSQEEEALSELLC